MEMDMEMDMVNEMSVSCVDCLVIENIMTPRSKTVRL